jgi:hypothetical protein
MGLKDSLDCVYITKEIYREYSTKLVQTWTYVDLEKYISQ